MKTTHLTRAILLALSMSILCIYTYATEVTIGTGTATQYYVGPTSYYKYSYSQVIYPQTEINQEGLITEIALENSSSYQRTHYVEIYMGTKSSTSFSSGTDWLPVSSMQLVFSGNVTIPIASAWYSITLDNPYYYFNTDNLVLAFKIDSESTNYSSTSLYKYTNRSGCSLYYRSSGSSVDPASPPSGSSSSYGMNLKLSMTQFPEGAPATPGLNSPEDDATNLEEHTLSWSMGLAYPPDGYYLSYGTNAGADNILNSQDMGYTLSYSPSLDDGETYYWKVKAYNSFGESDWSSTYSFTTFNGCEIGSASSSTYHLPFYTYYVDNTYSQCIYNQTDINKSGIITSLYLKHVSTKVLDWNNVEIYMGTKSSSTFASTTDWVSSENLQLVYSGDIHFDISSGYLEIPLDNPFYYTNTENLVIAYHTTESIRNTTSCYNDITSTSVTDAVLIKYGSTVTDMSDPGTASSNYRSELPDIKLAIIELDPGPPATPVISGPADNATDVWGENLTWSMGLAYPPDGYKLYFGTDNPPTNMINGNDIGDVTSYLPDLNFATTYYWQIEAYNTYGTSSKTAIRSFTTYDFSPAVSGTSQTSSPADSSITFTGSGFDPVPGNNTVLFGGVPANITAVTSNSISVDIPENATPGYIWINTGEATHISTIPFYPQLGSQEINAYLFNNESTIATNVDGGSYADVNIEVADFDQDGFADIAAIDETECIRIFKNDGTANTLSFTEQTSLTYSNIKDFTIGDFNSDGKVDIAAMNSSYQVYVYVNQSGSGSISFEAAQTFQPSGLEYGPGALTACDLNYDNMCDIFVAGWNEYVVMENTYVPGSKTTLSFDIGSDIYEGIGGTYKDVDFGDIDNDGDMDIVAQMNNGGSSHKSVYFQNQTTPGQSITMGPMTQISTASGYTQSLTLGDVDQDGLIDIILSNGDDVDVVRNNNTAAGTVSLDSPVTISNAGSNTYYTYQTKLADINADGYPEILHSNGKLFVIENNSTPGTLSFGTSREVTNVAKDFEIMDADNDGFFDIVFNKSGSDLAMLKSTLPPTVATSTPIIFGSRATLGGEVTNDGTLTVTERGVVYNTTGAPTTSDTKIQIGSGLGSFSQQTYGYSLGVTYYTRAYAINAAGTGYGVTKTFAVDALLPIELIEFNASPEENTLLAYWSTASEFNTDKFVLYLSKNMTDWEKFAEADAAGFSNTTVDYNQSIKDFDPGYKYIKLVEYDKDGQIFELSIKSIFSNISGDESFTVYPNPFTDIITLDIVNPTGGEVSVSVFDMNSKPLLRKTYDESSMYIQDKISLGNIPKGIYFIRIHTNDKTISKKIVKQ